MFHSTRRLQRCGIPMCDVTDELNNIYTAYHPHRDEYASTKSLAEAYNINLIFPPILLFCGTITNVLSIKVFLRPSLRDLNTSFLMRILAMVDILALNISSWDASVSYTLMTMPTTREV